MMEQRTDDWYAARAGKVTASRIADLMDKAKEDGDFSAIECGSPESGALRRASMDLTRALARMRAPQ